MSTPGSSSQPEQASQASAPAVAASVEEVPAQTQEQEHEELCYYGGGQGRITVDEENPERDDAVYRTGATPSPENLAQSPRVKRRHRRMVPDEEAPEIDDAARHIQATPTSENQAQRPRGLLRYLGVLADEVAPELDAVQYIRATPAPGKEAQNQQQQVSDEFLDAVEGVVMRAIPRYYCDSAESNGLPTQPPTIYMVPDKLTEGNVSAYVPVAVCIGLFFDRQPRQFDNIECYKRCCVRRLIVGSHPPGDPLRPLDWSPLDHHILRKCLSTLMRLEPRIEASYGFTIASYRVTICCANETVSGPMMLPMMLFDGCFILHRLLKYARMAKAEQGNGGGGGGGDDDDDWTQVFGQCSVWVDVTCDLLLLQNQIPFFVLRELFEHLKSHPEERDDVLVDGALRLFRTLHPTRLHSSDIACRDVHHLLHLLYLSIGFPKSTSDNRPSKTRWHHVPSEVPLWIPCAKELEDAGVRFRARKHGATSFLDVRFQGGVLEIPPLRLYDYSEPLFRNLIAFEQTYPFTPGDITAYAIFMDCLVKTHEDMRLLHQSGVLVNQMNGERDATLFFSRICAQAHTFVHHNYLAGVMKEVVRYQSSRWPRWRAALVRNYFSNPWVTTSLVAAVFLIALTVLQSFFAAYAYFKPPKQP